MINEIRSTSVAHGERPIYGNTQYISMQLQTYSKLRLIFAANLAWNHLIKTLLSSNIAIN